MDVSLVDAAKASGTTDGEGSFSFDIRLPDFLAGQAANHGAARVLIEATVKDNAGHSETQGVPIIVSESPLLVTGGARKRNSGARIRKSGFHSRRRTRMVLPRRLRFWFMRSTLRIRQRTRTRVAWPSFSCWNRADGKITVDAKDREGNHASVPVELESRTTQDAIMLHTEQALYRAGDRIRLQVRCTRPTGSVYVDVVKDGQTIATHDLDIVNGAAHLDLTATPDMAGTVDLNAYVFGRDGRPTGDHRMIFVQPADELRIEHGRCAGVQTWWEARIGFRVYQQARRRRAGRAGT